jgi:hypothetical protein
MVRDVVAGSALRDGVVTRAVIHYGAVGAVIVRRLSAGAGTPYRLKQDVRNVREACPTGSRLRPLTSSKSEVSENYFFLKF